LDEWSEIVLQERGLYGGIFHVKGGEPFVISYIWDMIDRLTHLQSLQLMLTTNGTFTGEKVFKKLSRCNEALDGHATIVVSLDGATEDTHAILRGKGHFAKTLLFLKGIRASGITLHLNCVLHKGNLHELAAYIELAKGFGASQVNFLAFVPRGIGLGFREFQLPHIEVYRHLDGLYKSGDEETKALLAGSLSHIKKRESAGEYQTSHECVAAYRGMFYITPEGNVNTCPNIVFPEFSLGNVLRNTLKEICEKLPKLHERLGRYADHYACSGEKILYEKQADRVNQESLLILSKELRSRSNNDAGEGKALSYCFSRNY